MNVHLSGLTGRYTFTPNPNKQVVSVTMPSNQYVILMAITTLGYATSGAPSPVEVPLGSYFNAIGIYNDTTDRTGAGINGNGDAYSEQVILADPVGGVDNIPFQLGTADQMNVITGSSLVTIQLTPGSYSAFAFLGSAVNIDERNQPFTVTYTDGTISSVTQSLNHRLTAPPATLQLYPGAVIESQMDYADGKL